MSECGKGNEEARRECSQTAVGKRRECAETRDDGYEDCSQTREDRQRKCCTWWPCSWGCKAFHWLVSVVCVAWHWVENIVCVAWRTIIEVACIAWVVIPALLCHALDLLSSIVGLIVAIFEAALNWAFSLVGFLLDVFLSIPYVGRALNFLLETGKAIFNAVISAPDFALTLFGVMPEKKLRLGVIVLKDFRGPVVTDEAMLLRSIQCAINIFRLECNIRVIPIRYTQYHASFYEPEQASGDYIFHDTLTSKDELLHACCEACAFGADFGEIGKEYQLIMSRVTYWGNGRRLTGYGAPIVAFTVRSFEGTSTGCSLGPFSNYVTVNFQDSNNGEDDDDAIANENLTPDVRLGRVSTLAHEIGHACNYLGHVSGNDNLMSQLSNGQRHCRLNRFQKALIRASRHVTYL